MTGFHSDEPFNRDVLCCAKSNRRQCSLRGLGIGIRLSVHKIHQDEMCTLSDLQKQVLVKIIIVPTLSVTNYTDWVLVGKLSSKVNSNIRFLTLQVYRGSEYILILTGHRKKVRYRLKARSTVLYGRGARLLNVSKKKNEKQKRESTNYSAS